MCPRTQGRLRSVLTACTMLWRTSTEIGTKATYRAGTESIQTHWLLYLGPSIRGQKTVLAHVFLHRRIKKNVDSEHGVWNSHSERVNKYRAGCVGNCRAALHPVIKWERSGTAKCNAQPNLSADCARCTPADASTRGVNRPAGKAAVARAHRRGLVFSAFAPGERAR